MAWQKWIRNSVKALFSVYVALAMFIFTLYLVAGFRSGILGGLMQAIYEIIVYC